MTVIDTSDSVSTKLLALRKRQVSAIGRYYSSRAWKRLTPSEASQASAFGFDLFTVFEDSGKPDLTVDSGVADGQIALGQAKAVGQPEGSAIYFALENLPSGYHSSDIPGLKLYAEGVAAVLKGKYRVGIYSNGSTLSALLEAGLCEFAWLSASRGFEGSREFYRSRRWQLAQDPRIDQDWGGLSVDVNEANGKFGAFRVESDALSSAFLKESAFSGEPEALWLSGPGRDREMKLLSDFWFRDPAGRRWSALAGRIVDGASIPKPLWSTVGSPYTGNYRRASIVHDVACEEAEGSWSKRRAADRMFYYACRAGGCSIFESTILYVGVRIGAMTLRIPAWRRAISAGEEPRIRRTPEQDRLEADFRMAAESVVAQGLTDDADEIERRTDVILSDVALIDLTCHEE